MQMGASKWWVRCSTQMTLTDGLVWQVSDAETSHTTQPAGSAADGYCGRCRGVECVVLMLMLILMLILILMSFSAE
jgi:hypothetical protein